MKIFNRSISAASLALLVIQLTLVSSVAAKYEVDRWRCPRVWTRAFGYDPQLPLRGRYLALQLRVDGCGSTLPSAAQARFPRDVNGSAVPGPFVVGKFPTVRFRANLSVDKGRLEAVRIQDEESRTKGQMVDAFAGASCDAMTLDQPVYYDVPDNYGAGSASSLFPLKPGQELWVEATIPPEGPPRPTQLAIKESGVWKPLPF